MCQFTVPDEVDLLSFFLREPIERCPEDGFFCYAVEDNRGVALEFSFHLFERSVQTLLVVNGTRLARVVHESAVRMWIDGSTLRCEFSSPGSATALSVRLDQDAIEVVWSSLRVR
jgi:hypothetical protein